MQKKFFWEDWHPQSKRPYLFLLGISLLLVLFYGYGFFFGEEITYFWMIEQDPVELELPLSSFYFLGFEFQFPAVFFLIYQKFHGSAPNILVEWGAFYLGATFFGLSLVLASITSLSRLWYIVAMAVFIFLLSSLQLEGLLFFGKSDSTLLISMVIGYLGFSYYFHAFNQDLSIWTRFVAFLLLTSIIALLIYFMAEVESPFLYLAAQSTGFSAILSVLFIFLIAHEIIYLFLYLITAANTPNSRNSAIHFVIISLIYLLILLFTWLTNIRFFEADLEFINAFLILVCSFVVGIFGFKEREVLYDNLFPFKQTGAVLYLGLAIITFTAIGYAALTANDPMVESFEDVIIFSHMGFGIIFFIYILANFFEPLHQNFKVFKVVYQPRRMPYFTYRLAGVVVVLAFFFQSGKISYEQAKAGKFNLIGDYYNYTGDPEIAIEFYNEGSIFGNFNHRSNYSLASIYRDQEELGDEQYFLKQSVRKNPTPYAYINLANSFYRNGKFFDALFVLREALEKYPGHGAIRNGLGLIFSKTDILDSAVFYFQTASKSKLAAQEAQANFYGLLAEKDLADQDDDLVNWFEEAGINGKTNLLAVLKRLDNKITDSQPFFESALSDSTLSLPKFSFLNNLILNQGDQLDSATLSFFAFQFNVANTSYRDYLKLAAALAFTEKYFNTSAYTVMQQLRYNGVIETEYILELMGVLGLRNDAPRLATRYLIDGLDLKDYDLTLPTALALIATDSSERAQTLVNYVDTLQGLEGDWVNLIGNLAWQNSTDDLSGQSLFLKLVSALPKSGHDQVEEMAEAIKDPLLEPLVFIYLANYHFQQENYDESLRWMNKLDKSNLSNLDVQMAAELLQFKLFWIQEKKDQLEAMLSSSDGMKFPTYYRQFGEGVLALANKNIDLAAKHFNSISIQNPFFEQGTIFIAEFYTDQGNEDKAYDILLNGIKINPYSLNLNKAYIKICLQQGLDQYAIDAISEFEKIMTNEAANQLMRYYNELQND